MSQDANTYILPPSLISKVDLARLVREVESIDSDLEAQKVRSHGEAQYSLPTMSRSLSDFLELNKIDVTDDQTRMAFKEGLQHLKDKAPIIHMTFAVEIEPESLQQLMDWLRKNIHPQALVSTGLQPSLVGGVYLRTPNHVHDFSMRELFKGKRDVLIRELEGLR